MIKCKKCRWNYINSAEQNNCTCQTSEHYGQLNFENDLLLNDYEKCMDYFPINKDEFLQKDQDSETMEF